MGPDLTLDLQIQEVTISQDGQVRISYILFLETKEYSGPIGGGQSFATDQDVLARAASLVEDIKRSALLELGLEKSTEEEPLDTLLDEDPL